MQTVTLPLAMTLRAFAVRRAAGAPTPADRVVLDYRDRFLRRKRLTTAGGAVLLVDLPETVSLEDGDALVLADGRLVAVEAAPEPLVEVTAAPEALARLAWHIGNRHTPAEIGAGRILRAARPRDRGHAGPARRRYVRPVMAPFRPEGGAYGHGRTHGHHHGGAGDDPDAPHAPG